MCLKPKQHTKMSECERIPALYEKFGYSIDDFLQNKISKEQLFNIFMEFKEPITLCVNEKKQLKNEISSTIVQLDSLSMNIDKSSIEAYVDSTTTLNEKEYQLWSTFIPDTIPEALEKLEKHIDLLKKTNKKLVWFQEDIDEIVHSGYFGEEFSNLIEKVKRIKNEHDACHSLTDSLIRERDERRGGFKFSGLPNIGFKFPSDYSDPKKRTNGGFKLKKRKY